MEFETLAIHDGQAPEPRTGAVSVPIYQTSTYEQDSIGHPRLGYDYSRSINPTRQALESALALAENGKHGLAFSSGSAATVAALQVLKPGDQILAGNDTYGGTYRIFERILRPWGVDTRYVDAADASRLAEAITPATRLIWIESPTNPLLKLADIAALAELANRRKLLLAVDNTFASPYLQQPLNFGAHIVVHSTTKYLGGHSDVVGGAFITSDQAVYETVKYYQNAAGAVPGPWDSWLVWRGLKTLKVRMREHSASALHLAQVLEKHPAVSRVYYPGLPSHPQHELAKRQMRDFGTAVADASSDAAITAKIKAKFALDRDLSALSISVNTTAGHVTLAGTVPSDKLIGKAVMLALETDGVREVSSTLKVNAPNG